jgi:hypothetical protein
MPEERSLEEQVVAQVLQLGLSSQVDSAEAVNVEVRTDLPQVVQGQVNALAVSGQGMVIQDIRMQELEVQTDRISVNLLSALLGKLELDHPVNASARITFTEADLNQTINADQVVQMMRPLELEVEGEIVQVELQFPLRVQLPGGGRIQLAGTAELRKVSGSRQVGFEAVIVPCNGSLPMLIESFGCQPGQGLTLEFTIALMQKFKELLSLPRLEIAGMAVRLNRVDVQAGSLTIESEAHVHQIPSL